MSLEFVIWNIFSKKTLFEPFPYRACVSHKNDSPNVTQKVECSIKGLVVDLSILFL